MTSHVEVPLGDMCMLIKRLAHISAIVLIVATITLLVTPVSAQPNEITFAAGVGEGPAVAAAMAVPTFREGTVVPYYAWLWTPRYIESWDVSCVPEAVWPARDRGIRLVGQDGVAHSLRAGESQTIKFYFALNKAGQYNLACYFYVEGAFIGRSATLINVVK